VRNSAGVPLHLESWQYFSMVGSRRQRNAKEGSFLEAVKGLLEELKSEVYHIKAAVDEIKTAHQVLGFLQYPWSNAHQTTNTWDDWQAWDALGWDASACSVPCGSVIHADGHSFSPPSFLHKDTLLQYKMVSLNDFAPPELKTLRTEHILCHGLSIVPSTQPILNACSSAFWQRPSVATWMHTAQRKPMLSASSMTTSSSTSFEQVLKKLDATGINQVSFYDRSRTMVIHSEAQTTVIDVPRENLSLVLERLRCRGIRTISDLDRKLTDGTCDEGATTANNDTEGVAETDKSADEHDPDVAEFSHAQLCGIVDMVIDQFAKHAALKAPAEEISRHMFDEVSVVIKKMPFPEIRRPAWRSQRSLEDKLND